MSWGEGKIERQRAYDGTVKRLKAAMSKGDAQAVTGALSTLEDMGETPEEVAFIYNYVEQQLERGE